VKKRKKQTDGKLQYNQNLEKKLYFCKNGNIIKPIVGITVSILNGNTRMQLSADRYRQCYVTLSQPLPPQAVTLGRTPPPWSIT